MNRAEVRAVVRLARRTARREWRRTTLVAALVAVPVMVGILVAGLVRASEVTPAERVTSEMGAADVRVQLHGYGPEPMAADAPDVQVMDRLVQGIGAEHTVRYRATGWYHTGAGLLDGSRVTDVPLGDPLVAGMYRLVDGRPPRAADEIALSEGLLRRGDLALGDTVELVGAGAVTVVAAIVDPTAVRHPVAVTAPATLDLLLEAYDAGATPAWLLGGVPSPETAQQDLLAAYDRATGYRQAHEEVHAQEQGQQARPAEVADQVGPAAAALPAHPEVTSRAAMLRDQERMAAGSGLDRVITPQVLATLVAAVLLAEVALIAGAAYATGARRRLRELGLLGANGATHGHVRAAVVGEATVTGIVGAAAGVVAGVAALGIGRPLLQRFVGPLITRLELSVSDLIGPALVAVAAVSVAAWLPARTAARVPTTTALEGRMPLSPPPRWIVPAGIVLASLGALLLLTGILAAGPVGGAVAALGILLAIGGTALLTVPMIARIGRLADRFPATLRLVLRDSGRQRTRAAAASASAMVVLIAPVLIASVSLSLERHELVRGLPQPEDQVLLMPDEQAAAFRGSEEPPGSAPDREAMVAAIAEVLPDAAWARVPILDVRASVAPDPRFTAPSTGDELQFVPGGMGPEAAPSLEERLWSYGLADTHVASATDDVVAALGHPGVSTSIGEGRIVVLGLAARDTSVTVDGQELPAVEVPARVLHYGMPRVLVPPARTEALGLQVAGVADLFVTPEPITAAERDAVQRTVHTGGLHIAPVGPGNGAWLRWAAVGTTLVIALVILALVTMLSATESDHDLRTMVAVGAAPRMRRRFLGLQSGVHALVGAALAVPLALGLTWAMSRAEANIVNEGVFGAISARAIWVDWPTVGAVLFGVPLIVGLAIALLVRSAPTVPPRRLG